jgi:uncharacterized membrane protein
MDAVGPEPDSEIEPHGTARAAGGLTLVLIVLATTLVIGAAIRQPCASGDWADGRQYSRLCYTDIVPLYGAEHLEGDRLPYLNPCPTGPGNCDEYPVMTMWWMRLTAWAAPGPGGFYGANAFGLAVAALVTTVCLYLAVGKRALFFAAAPTLAVYSFINWDLLVVALATAATVAYLRRRDALAGVLLGLGAATKFYPLLLVVPFVVGRFRSGRKDAGIHLAWAAAGAWLVVNLPFALLAPGGWWEFFRFNSARAADWDSLWFMGCDALGSQGSCPAWSTPWINSTSLALFGGLALAVWWIKTRRQPGFPAWTFGLPLLILFLLTNKVYSPQYSLWLLPWFALVLPDVRLFLAFELADVAVFVTRFSYFGRIQGVGGLDFAWFRLAILVRAIVLVACLLAWVRRRADLLEEAAPRRGVQPEASSASAEPGAALAEGSA